MNRIIRLALCVLLGLGGAAAVPAANGIDGKEPAAVDLPDAIPAFPGAWGGGMFTVGGRGGQVIQVTNLDDRGPGSLRAAVETEGPRIVVFRVAGIIRLKSELEIEHPYITLAGQTAPGDGICVTNETTEINTHNVIIRHMRFRRGLAEKSDDNVGGHPEHHVIVDHCSTSWGMDENISLYRKVVLDRKGKRHIILPTSNVTIQWTISSEGLDARKHAFGGTWGGRDSTFHHNLFACNTGRNPSIGMTGKFDYRNNVIFNWRHRTMDGGDERSMVNVINNYYKPGPATEPGVMQHRIARAEMRNMYDKSQPKRPGKWYVAGNIVEGHPKVSADNWAGGVQIIEDWGQGTPEDYAMARVDEPFAAWPINQQRAEEAFDAVLSQAGATLPRRDAVDHRIVESVRTGKVLGDAGIVNDPAEVGGLPKYEFDPDDVPADSDADGMPDLWEARHGLDKADPADSAADADEDGYTNIEEYLNGTNPRQFMDYKDLTNNVDTIS